MEIIDYYGLVDIAYHSYANSIETQINYSSHDIFICDKIDTFNLMLIASGLYINLDKYK